MGISPLAYDGRSHFLAVRRPANPAYGFAEAAAAVRDALEPLMPLPECVVDHPAISVPSPSAEGTLGVWDHGRGHGVYLQTAALGAGGDGSPEMAVPPACASGTDRPPDRASRRAWGLRVATTDPDGGGPGGFGT
jgi:hypothetical protein